METTVIAGVLRQMQAHPERPALIASDAQLTYAELQTRMLRWAQQLDSLSDTTSRARVGVLTGDSAEVYAAILGILYTGACYVPLNAHHPASRNAQIIEDARLEVVLAPTEHAPLIDASAQIDQEVNILYPNESPIAGSVELKAPQASPDDLMYLLFTSGSTGRPKGVPLHHRNVTAFFEAMLESGLYDFGAEDVFVQMFELTFDLSVFSTFAPWLVGGTCVIVPEAGIGALKVYETLEDHACTVALLVPSVLSHLQRYFDEIDLPEMRYSLFCGEALPHHLAEGWSKCVPNARVENNYGPTEATIFCTRYVFEPEQSAQAQRNGIVNIGQALPGMELLIQKDDQTCEDGEEGELLLIGPQVTSCYWFNAEKTAAAFTFVDNGSRNVPAYRTGDWCVRNAAGNINYLDRIDNQVKIEGYRVELGEIEHHLREAVPDRALAVVAVPNTMGNMELHAFLEGEEQTELQVKVKASLPPYMQPRNYHFLDALPLNLNGKIDRPKLKGMVG